MRVPEAAPVEPVVDDGVGASVVGTVLWALAAVGCILGREHLAERGSEWWLLTCLSGVIIGALMIAFTTRRARVYRAHRVRLAAASPQTEGPGGGPTVSE